MMKWWKKFFKTAGRIWWRWDVRFCAIPTGRSIQQQSMESPGMCRSLIRELITFDLVKQTEDIAGELDPTQQAEQSGWGRSVIQGSSMSATTSALSLIHISE